MEKQLLNIVYAYHFTANQNELGSNCALAYPSLNPPIYCLSTLGAIIRWFFPPTKRVPTKCTPHLRIPMVIYWFHWYLLLEHFPCNAQSHIVPIRAITHVLVILQAQFD